MYPKNQTLCHSFEDTGNARLRQRLQLLSASVLRSPNGPGPTSIQRASSAAAGSSNMSTSLVSPFQRFFHNSEPVLSSATFARSSISRLGHSEGLLSQALAPRDNNTTSSWQGLHRTPQLLNTPDRILVNSQVIESILQTRKAEDQAARARSSALLMLPHGTSILRRPWYSPQPTGRGLFSSHRPCCAVSTLKAATQISSRPNNPASSVTMGDDLLTALRQNDSLDKAALFRLAAHLDIARESLSQPLELPHISPSLAPQQLPSLSNPLASQSQHQLSRITEPMHDKAILHLERELQQRMNSIDAKKVIEPEASAAFVPLAIEQDINWLSECQCLLRAEFIEITQVSRKDFLSGDEYLQVGLRCRYCSHLPSWQRIRRSSAFPSSIKQLYQSFTMMQRDHFPRCMAIPPEKRERLDSVRKTNGQGACDSKEYWIYAAQKVGMFDTPRGIEITSQSCEEGKKIPLFGVTGKDSSAPPQAAKRATPELLLLPSNAPKIHPFLALLLLQLEIVELLPSQQVGKYKSLPKGFRGLGCRYCCPRGRLGFSCTFPLRRGALPGKLDDMFAHFMRCSCCPSDIKSQLARWGQDERKTIYHQRPELLDTIWKQLGTGRDGGLFRSESPCYSMQNIHENGP